jgi:hypothetical protein
MDNLPANKTPAIRRWARRENAGLCFTPASASWANPIEAQFGPLRTFVMGGSDHPDKPSWPGGSRTTAANASNAGAARNPRLPNPSRPAFMAGSLTLPS